jgi:hypothetical protein
MSSLLSLSLSIAVLGGIWAYLALGPLAGFVLVWAGFIAWGCFFHSGGDGKALTKTICGTVYGAVVGWIALLIIFKFGVGGMGVAAIAAVVAVTVFFLVIVASMDALSVVPANVYGYAAIVAYALHAAGAQDNLTVAGFANPLLLLIASLIAGAVMGYISGAAAKAITSSTPMRTAT